MSYPDPRYLGDQGEISARFRPADTPPDFVATGVAPAAYHYLSTTLSTQGEYGLYRVDMGPESAGPATHFHKAMSEAFFVLSGTIRLFDGERWVDARSGDHLYVPVGGLHAFRNESGEPASMLMLFAPGAPREEYFERIGDLAGMSEADRAAFLVKHDSFFV
ncbi:MULTISPECIES: cupin domain-containing protein [unclassified Streptomyces]|uniref:cupin domain-containing protein n=1 Tax=unclassified Streptomyces TaxID=2593676 RepID=UPI0004C5E86A|nr:cupin domain-containing protein [Streptomyces sp. NRRL F-5727]